MINLLANDGIDSAGKALLEAAGFIISEIKIPQEELEKPSSLRGYDGIIVRSGTKVTRKIIENNSHLKVIARAGVGIDNIDLPAALNFGITVINTPEASSRSVSELAFAHLYTGVRNLHRSNRKMCVDGNSKFSDLKKEFSSGMELKNKTLGIIGFGRIGQATAAIAFGNGMKVIAFDTSVKSASVKIEIDGLPLIEKLVTPVEFESVIRNSDFISLHVPHPEGSLPLITSKEFGMMKDQVGIVNASRGGVISESDLVDALNSGKVAFAGLDVYENEPCPTSEILLHPHISLSPHIGASTIEAQERIGIELAEKLIAFFSNQSGE